MTEIKHEVTLFAEPIAYVGGFTITNSLLTSWIAVFILLIFAFVLRKKMKMIPRGIQNVFEILMEGALELSDTITGSREKSQRVFPIAFTFFLFILLNNYLGLLPGVGSIGFFEPHGEESIFVPYFRGGTADLNTTLAFSLFAVVATHIFGIMAVGATDHFNKFFNFKALLEIPKKVLHDPTIILVSPIKVFVGIIEVIGEIAKAASLALRLFGNIFAGEVLLVSISSLVAYIAPIPFIFLEIIVGLVQALVFSMLTLVFASIAMTKEEH